MLHKTRGIVLSYLKYKETSVIARIYTEQFGIQSYIINSIRSVKSKKGLALLQPLTALDMVVYHKTHNPDGLNRISEYKPTYNFSSIPFDIKKSTMALFVTELLSKVLREEEHHGAVFEFLFQFIQTLDHKAEDFETLHIYLMIQLTHYIGFGIHSQEQLTITNGTYGVENNDQIADEVLKLSQKKLSDPMPLTNSLRRATLQYMVDYYILHIEGFDKMHSMQVLAQIFQ
jgi:DNA repair protein RecO (recombination protein O)